MRNIGVGGVMQRFSVLLGILAVSAAASHAAPAAAPQKPAAAKPAVPTDGQPRIIERRGKFVIRQNTVFCPSAGDVHHEFSKYGARFYALIDYDIMRSAFSIRGLSTHYQGSERVVMPQNRRCRDRSAILLFGSLVPDKKPGDYVIKYWATQNGAMLSVAKAVPAEWWRSVRILMYDLQDSRLTREESERRKFQSQLGRELKPLDSFITQEIFKQGN